MSLYSRAKGLLSHEESSRAASLFHRLLSDSRPFLECLNRADLRLDDWEPVHEAVGGVLGNRAATVAEKARFLERRLAEMKVRRNVLELAILAHRSELQRSEKTKLRGNTKGVFVGRDNGRRCFKCGRGLRGFPDGNENLLIFPACQHFAHLDCLGPIPDSGLPCGLCQREAKVQASKTRELRFGPHPVNNK